MTVINDYGRAVGVKTLSELREGLYQALTDAESDIDLTPGGSLTDVTEFDLAERAEDHLALQEAVNQTSWRTATGIYLEREARSRGIIKGLGQKARYYLTAGRSTLGTIATAKAGDRVGTSVNKGIEFVVLADTTLNTGAYERTVLVEAEFIGDNYNLEPGDIDTIISGFEGFEFVTNKEGDQAVTGEDIESDDNLRRQIELFYEKLHGSLNDYGWEAWAREVADVRDVQIVPNDPDRGDLDFYFTVYEGNYIPSPLKIAELKTELIKHALIENINVYAALAINVTIQVGLWLDMGDVSQVQTALEVFVNNAFTDFPEDGGVETRIFHLNDGLKRFPFGSRLIEIAEEAAQGVEVENLGWKSPVADVEANRGILQLIASTVFVFNNKSDFDQWLAS